MLQVLIAGNTSRTLYTKIECADRTRESAETFNLADGAWQVISPLLRVLARLHAEHIIHRDIKPENLFLTRKRQLKLGDLGLAIKSDEELPFTRSGTLDYMSPSVHNSLVFPLHGSARHTRAFEYKHTLCHDGPRPSSATITKASCPQIYMYATSRPQQLTACVTHHNCNICHASYQPASAHQEKQQLVAASQRCKEQKGRVAGAGQPQF